MLIVLPSVGYADCLAVTLPAWQAVAPAATLRVVTSPEDTTTQAVARDAGVGLVVTDIWRKGAVFNKARALDEAFGFGTSRAPAPGAWCLATDADVWPGGVFPDLAWLQADTIYGCPRYLVDTPAQLRQFQIGRLSLWDLPLILPRRKGEPGARLLYQHGSAEAARVATAGLGFCQLFTARPGLAFGSSATAGGYDQAFARRFPTRRALTGFYVLHLGPQDRANWQGRVVPRWGAA